MFRRILTFFDPQTLADRASRFNQRILVKQSKFGHRYITTNNHAITQSGGIVRQVWQPALDKVAQKGKSWLILGLAGGTIPQVISQKYFPAQMVGVEIDPVMIEVGREFFGLARIPKLQIVKADARKYVSRIKSPFDYVLVDLYYGDRPPDFIYHDDFLNRLAKSGQTVVFNHLFHTPDSKAAASQLVHKLEAHFSGVTLVRSLANLLVVCTPSA